MEGNWGGVSFLRVLVDKLASIVNLVVDDEEKILLGVVLSNVLVRELERHVC